MRKDYEKYVDELIKKFKYIDNSKEKPRVSDDVNRFFKSYCDMEEKMKEALGKFKEFLEESMKENNITYTELEDFTVVLTNPIPIVKKDGTKVIKPRELRIIKKANSDAR